MRITAAILLLFLTAVPVMADKEFPTYLSGQSQATTPPASTDRIPILQSGPVVKLIAPTQLERVVTGGTCSTSYTVNPATGGSITLTLNGACEIGVTNLTAGQGFTLYLTQSATTAPTFTSAYKWALGTAPTWSATATKYDTVSCASPDGVKLICGAVIDAR